MPLSPTLLPRPLELCHPLSEEDDERLLPILPDEPLFTPELPELPRLPELLLCDPVRRLGSFSRFSLRPMF